MTRAELLVFITLMEPVGLLVQDLLARASRKLLRYTGPRTTKFLTRRSTPARTVVSRRGLQLHPTAVRSANVWMLEVF